MGVSAQRTCGGVQALGQGVGHLGVWGHLRAQQPSLPAGTALGQAVQDGLQVLLVGAEL